MVARMESPIIVTTDIIVITEENIMVVITALITEVTDITGHIIDMAIDTDIETEQDGEKNEF